MKKKILSCLVTVTAVLILSISDGFSWSSYGDNLDTICAPPAPYNGNCDLCHSGDKADSIEAQDAYASGGTILTDFFCAAGPR